MRIGNIRVDIEVILDLWPYLRAKLERDFAKAYGYGRQVASEALGMPPETFPESLPVDPGTSADGTTGWA